MSEQSKDHNISPGAGNSPMCPIARGEWPRAIEHLELFLAQRGEYSDLMINQTLNNCFIT